MAEKKSQGTPVIKKFLRRTTLFFLVPLAVAAVVEAFVLPPNFFTYRTWEALIYKNPVPHTGNFYPDMHVQMDEQGDLAFRTKYAVIKKDVLWNTDHLGYRNDVFIEDPDILLIGDSFTAGIVLSQDETITNRLKVLLGKKVKVYNMAPSSFGNFVHLCKKGIIKKPRLIIFSSVERNLPSLLTVAEEEKSSSLRTLRKMADMTGSGKTAAVIDRLISFNFLRWAKGQLNETRMGHRSPSDSTLFFMQGSEVKLYTKEDARITAEKIESYKKYCDKEGIQFLFMPMPNKETVYYNMVPLPVQSPFLFQLDSLLAGKGIATFNTLSVYNNVSGKMDMLYKPDDTHWNEKGTALIAGELVKHPLLKSFTQAGEEIKQ